MSWLTENKPYAVFLTYLGLFIILVITMIIVYKFMPDAKEIIGFLLGACGTLLTLIRDAAKDFGFDGKVNN